MSQWFTDLQNYVQAHSQDWSGSVLFITLASFIAWIAWRVIRSRLAILVEKTPFHWDNMLLDALKAPVSTLIWCWPATVSLGIILESELNDKINWLSTLKLILIISVFVWTVMRLITNIEDFVLEQKNRDETTVQAIAKVGRLFIITIGVLTIMQAFGLSLSGLLTFGGVGGLIVGLAAKDLLSNFFGGLMIYFDRPFKVGDW
ncbi:mechanosensitive ion channel family protein, partial [Vibrio parahaemolyticus]